MSIYRIKYTYIVLVFLSVFALPAVIFGQDSVKKTTPLIKLPELESVEVYDADTDSYLFYKKGEENSRKPYKVVPRVQYNMQRLQKQMNESRIKIKGAPSISSNISGIIPSLQTNLNSQTLKSMFGGDNIKINFSGYVEVLLGIKSTKIDNPLIPPQNRRITSPDFDTKYSLNLTGSIGERINLNFNFDPQATFNFDTNLKIAYEADEDDIVQIVEIGNITMPLQSTLITGSQSLFGGKVGLRFGKLDMTLVASQQRGQAKTMEVRGGAQSSEYEVRADDYDANKHFFLSQYFRDNYEKSLSQLPLIVSGVNITRLEVWVTNKVNRPDNVDVRNIVAFMDLAENTKANIYNTVPTFVATGMPSPANEANGMYKALTTTYSGLREFAKVNSVLGSIGNGFRLGQDYEKLERARKLSPQEYTFHSQLGFISLNMALNNDEVLAVAYEYTYNGRTYKVGELSTAGTTATDSTLIVKMLKGTILTPKLPTWKLMMKNVYDLRAYNLSPTNFVLDVYYDDSNLGTSVPYISEGAIAKQPLLTALSLDRLNENNDPYPDGLYDFVNGVTVIPDRGKVIFPILEPFGRFLEKKINDNSVAPKYVYKQLYDSTITKAREFSHLNKFFIRGRYEATNQGEIKLDAMNIPQGSVTVMAGGVKLAEGVDYQVNYMYGTVTITNPMLLESGTPISITLEDRGQYNLQTKTMVGANLDYKFSEKFRLGGTILHLNEKPMTQKTSYGEDPVSNTIWGLNTSYRTESDMLTTLINNIPLMQKSKSKSAFSIDAEFANLISGQPKGIRGKVFIDDFDGAKSYLDLKNYIAWTLAGTPHDTDIFPNGDKSDISNRYDAARLAWNWIDPELLRNSSNTPAMYRNNPGRYQENFYVCNFPVTKLFPNRQVPEGMPTDIQTLNLHFYPRERAQYNYNYLDVDRNGFFNNPEKRWGGIMRSLPVTDFETANYDYIEFWLMDPFVYNKNSKGGDFLINLGTISEDVLRDGYKSYEQGIPFPFDSSRVIKTPWGYVPKNPALVNNFDNNADTRRGQDVGLDGLRSEQESVFFSDFLQNIQSIIAGDQLAKLRQDPSSDNFVYYRDGSFDNDPDADILRRYKYFNNPEGNSSQGGSGQNSQVYTTYPDMEDINRDNTMEEGESYFQYRIKMHPNMKVGENFVSDIVPITMPFANNGEQTVNWYHFKVPLDQYEKTIGPISDFKSVRFMRMIMRNFSDTTVMRFASLEMVRNEWRKYDYSLLHGQEGLTQPETPETDFAVSAVNIEEDGIRQPVNYMMPPGTDRVIDPSTVEELQLNEQALQLSVRKLPDGDARAVYKNLNFDLRQYRRLQMDVHAESLPEDLPIGDNELSVFIRMGSDLKNNYYEYEIPLKVTPPGQYLTEEDRLKVWMVENMLDIELSELTDLKIFRNNNAQSVHTMYEKKVGDHILRVIGNPNLGEVRVIMLGVRNPIDKENKSQAGVTKSGTIWLNELRLTDFENRGGWAANMSTGVRLADFGNISLSGGFMTAGFGGLEQRQRERSKEDVYRYDVLSNFELGKFFSPKAGVRIPIFIGFSERYANPLYDPLSKDVLYRDMMRGLESKAMRDSVRNLVQDFTRRKSFNITNMNVSPEGWQQGVLSLSNLSANFAFNELYQHNINVERYYHKEYRGGIRYGYSIEPKPIEPFKNIGFLQSHWFSLIRDFNFNLVLDQFDFTTDMYRMYTERQNRNIAFPEAKLPGYYSKDFTWNRHYNLSWKLAKSLTLNYFATNIARIDEPIGRVNKNADREAYAHWRDSVWSNIVKLGRNVSFTQSVNVIWEMPFKKFKPLDWVTGNAQYNGRYNWDAAPIILENDFGYVYDPGNIIVNGRVINGNFDFKLTDLYNKVKPLKAINDQFDRKLKTTKTVDAKYESRALKFRANSRRGITHNLGTQTVSVKVVDDKGNTLNAKSEVSGNNRVYVTLNADADAATVTVSGKVEQKEDAGMYSMKAFIRGLMMVRTVNINYNKDESTTLPGFKGDTKFFGVNNLNGRIAPGLDFVFGGQATDFLIRAKDHGWITKDSLMTSPYIRRKSERVDFRMKIEPIKDFIFELKGLRGERKDITSFDITKSFSPTSIVGSFEISTISIGTAFESSGSKNSSSFRNFDKYRKVTAWKQAEKRQSETGGMYSPGGGVYPDGYNGLSQDVVVPAFVATYLGKNASNSLNYFWNIPLPGWDIRYEGLTKAALFKKYFSSGSIRHGYSSVYRINAYNSNADFVPDQYGYGWQKNSTGNFITENDIFNVSIEEHFNPLFGLDLTWKNSLKTGFMFSKNRTLGLSLISSQIAEFKNNVYTFELGYNFKKVPLIFKFGNNRSKKVDTDLKLSGRVSLVDEKTLIRSFAETEQDPQISGGNKITRMNFAADYNLYKGVLLRLYFNHDYTLPYVSDISVSNTSGGFSLRFTLSQF